MLRPYTTEQLLGRWEDRREIQNLMGRYTSSLMLKRERVLYEEFWTATQEPCLGLNHGYYKGEGAVRGYYNALHEQTLLRTKLFAADFPEQYAAMSEEEAYGAGVLNYKPLSNQIIEIAEDGKTAKAFWYAMGMYDEITAAGPLSFWTWGMFGVDLVKEGDDWKLWHLIYVEDVNHPGGESWAAPAMEREPVTVYAPMAEFKLPEPTVAKTVREKYSPDRPFTEVLPLPEPYATFAETFSYGI